MITAKGFASMHSVWRTAAPSLEQFNRWVNSGSRHRNHMVPVRRLGDPLRSSLIAETAFKKAVSKNLDWSAAEDAARAYLERLPGPPKGGPLSPEENSEARRIARNIEKYVFFTWWEGAQALPVFPGCGFVGTAVGDLLVTDDHLIEVKTVERGFRALDFRQALTYSAMAYASGVEIRRISLVNPRRATSFVTSTSNLAFDIGAASWIDLMQTVVNAMTDVNPSQ